MGATSVSLLMNNDLVSALSTVAYTAYYCVQNTALVAMQLGINVHITTLAARHCNNQVNARLIMRAQPQHTRQKKMVNSTDFEDVPPVSCRAKNDLVAYRVIYGVIEFDIYVTEVTHGIGWLSTRKFICSGLCRSFTTY